jgi:hypothetical protein
MVAEAAVPQHHAQTQLAVAVEVTGKEIACQAAQELTQVVMVLQALN